MIGGIKKHNTKPNQPKPKLQGPKKKKKEEEEEEEEEKKKRPEERKANEKRKRVITFLLAKHGMNGRDVQW